jgi:hypothetical protein
MPQPTKPLPVLGYILVVLSLILGTSSVQAASSNIIPLHFFRSADCTGEIVEISGLIHLVSQQQSDGSVIGHFNYQDVTAYGQTSGLVYRVAAVDHFRLSAPFPSSIHSVRSFYLISEGAAENLLVHIVYLITVNANGDVTALIEKLDMSCV